MGPWLPEPILTEETQDAADPEKRVEREESISLAFLVLLEQLQPFERAVFLLREVFAYEFAEIANMLEKSEVACRRSFSRAKQHLMEQWGQQGDSKVSESYMNLFSAPFTAYQQMLEGVEKTSRQMFEGVEKATKQSYESFEKANQSNMETARK